MRVITLEERNGSVSRIIARFAVDGDLGEDLLRPDLLEISNIRDALYDYIMQEKAKVEEVLTSREEQSKRDADLVSGLIDIETKRMAAAEAYAAHIAAQQREADKAVIEAQEKLKEAKARNQ